MKYYCAFLLVLLAGCRESETIAGKNDLFRYENTEVVCYTIYNREGIWCHWKGATK